MTSHKDLEARIAKLPPEKQAEFRRRLKEKLAKRRKDGEIARAEYGDEAPLSCDQQRMWFLQTLHPESRAYQVPFGFRITGEIQVEAMRSAFLTLMQRHESLRTHYLSSDGVPFQRIVDRVDDVPFVFRDLRGTPDVEALARATVDEAIARPFELEAEFPLRIHLLRLTDEQSVLHLLFHHISVDEWAIGVLIQELSAIYGELCGGDLAQLPEPTLQMADYAIWQQQQLAGGHFQAGLDFWTERLKGAVGTIEWPVGVQPGGGLHPEGYFQLEWDVSIVRALEGAAQQVGASAFVTGLTAFGAFLSFFTGQSDLVIGVPVLTRQRVELSRLVGLVLNTLPWRFEADAKMTLLECLERNWSAWREASAHQGVPFDEIVKVSGMERHGSAALFDVMFTFVEGEFEPSFSGVRQVEDYPYDGKPEAQCALGVTLNATAEKLRVAVDFDKARFDQATVEELIDRFRRFLEVVSGNPAAPLGAMTLVEADEKTDLVRIGRGTISPTRELVPALYRSLATSAPNRTCLVTDDGEVTYAEFDRVQSAIASLFRQTGIGRGDVVALYVGRRTELYAAFLAAWCLGATVLPLDPTYPVGRVAFMIRDSGARVVFADRDVEFDIGEARILRIEHLSDGDTEGLPTLCASDPAYVLYTSGTTGKPKGVVVTHGGLANRTYWFSKQLDCGAADRFLQKTPLGFDVAVSEIVTPLATGGVLVAVTLDHRDPDAIMTAVKDHRVTILDLVPSQLEVLLEREEFVQGLPTLRYLVVGGERLRSELVTGLLGSRDIPLLNAYGPTELTIDCVAWECSVRADGAIPIGKPADNLTATVVRGYDYVGADVAGELWVGGPHVAQGYIGRPRLTATKFVPGLGGRPGGRCYRTGDVVRWNDDWTLEFRGRLDEQIKLRGNRIELGEVEHALEALPSVEQAVACVVGGTVLVAFVRPSSIGFRGEEELRDGLRTYLPDYMIPTRFQSVSELPLLPNQKVDRTALLTLLTAPETPSEGRVPPRDEVERTLVEIWAKHLEHQDFGIHDSFFTLGGHSLLAVRLQHDVQEEFGVHLVLAEMLNQPTIAALAQQIRDGGRPAAQIPRVAHDGDAPLSSEQRRMWFLHRLDPEGSAYHVPTVVRLGGALNLDAMQAALQFVVDRHEVLRTQYHETAEGPRQRILSGARAPWVLEDVPDEDSAHRRVAEEIARPFNLETDLPMRVLCLRLSPSDHVLVLLMHHIAIDEWTTDELFAELGGSYVALAAGRNPEWPSPPLQYADYAFWQQQRFQGEEFDAGRHFWTSILAGRSPGVTWPWNSNDQVNQPARVVQRRLTGDLSGKLRQLAGRQQTTEFVAMLGLYGAFLTRFLGRKDLTVGLPVTQRERPELQMVLGFFLNTVPFRLQIEPALGLEEAVSRVARDWTASLPHHWIPLDEIVKATPGRLAAFDTMFTFVPEGGAGELGSLEVERFGGAAELTPKTTLEVHVTPSGDETVWSFIHDVSSITSHNAEVLADAFVCFAEHCVSAPTADLRGGLPQPMVLPERWRSDFFESSVDWPFSSPNVGRHREPIGWSKKRMDRVRDFASAHDVEPELAVRTLFSAHLLAELGEPELVICNLVSDDVVDSRVAPVRLNGGSLTEVANGLSLQLADSLDERISVADLTKLWEADGSPFDVVIWAGSNLKAEEWPGELPATLHANLHLRADVLDGWFEVDSSKIPRDELQRWLERWGAFVDAVLAAPHSPRVSWPEGVPHQDATGPTVKAKAIWPVLWPDLVEQHGESEALRGADGTVVTYRALADRAHEIAWFLNESGVRAGDRVGVCMSRSSELVATLIGIWEAGAAYVAVQPELPAERLQFIARDSQIVGVVCDAHSPEVDWEVPVFRPPEGLRKSPLLEAQEITGDDAAYVLYTSGSTGTPKGVCVSHRAVANLVTAIDYHGLFDSDTVTLFKTAYGFDVSVSELFSTLQAGGSLVIAPPGLEKDPGALVEFIQRNNVSLLRLVPTALELLLAANRVEECQSLKTFVMAGEALSPSASRSATELPYRPKLFNLLGATETTVDSTFHQCSDGDVAVGRPLPNYRTHVVGPAGAEVTPWRHGELWVGGDSVADGYVGLPRRTAQSFVPDPFGGVPGARLYRTGDHVYRDVSGVMHYVGRTDNQLQIRGVRVELSEVENQLAALDEILIAAVQATNERHGRADGLLAYVVFKPNMSMDSVELQRRLLQVMPASSIPAQFVVLDEMPRTSSGKIDRGALPSAETAVLRADYEAPRTAEEVRLSVIWSEVLGVDRIGRHDDFFAIGGHSLLAVQLQHQINAEFGFVALGDLLDSSTLSAQALLLVETPEKFLPEIGKRPDSELVPLSPDQRRMWFLQNVRPDSTAYNIPMVLELQSPQTPELVGQALSVLISRHEILRTLYEEKDGVGFQRIVTEPDLPFKVVDVADDAEARALIQIVSSEPFDLGNEFSLRATYIRRPTDASLLLLEFHHIAVDEWALGLVRNELLSIVESLGTGQTLELAPLSLQYADVAYWQVQMESSSAFDDGIDFWRGALSAAAPTDWPLQSPATNVSGVGRIEFSWGQTDVTRLQAFARQHKTTLFVASLAIFGAFVGRVCCAPYVTVGLPVTQRSLASGLENVVGMLLNTVAFPIPARAHCTLDDILTEVASLWRSSQKHHWVPLDDVMKNLPSRGEAEPFDVMFTFLQQGGDLSEWGHLAEHDAKFPLTCAISPSDDGVQGSFEFDMARFDARDVERLAEGFTLAMRRLLSGGHVGDLVWTDRRPLPISGPQVEIDEVFPLTLQRTAARIPGRVALTDGKESLTYSELVDRIDRHAAALIEFGLRPDQRVGVSMKRGVDLIVTLLAILRAGGAYVPLQPSGQTERLRYLCEDSGLELVVVDESGRQSLPELPGVSLVSCGASAEAGGFATPDLDQLAWVIYTSGTTGRPKGVEMPHRGLASLARAYAEISCDLKEESVAAVGGAYSFDLFVAELFAPLRAGSKVVVLPDGLELEPAKLTQFLVDQCVTEYWTTPTLHQLLSAYPPDPVRHLRRVYAGGEALTGAVAEGIRSLWGEHLYNIYGPTEMCVAQTFSRVANDLEGIAPIGVAIPNHAVDVLDPYLIPQAEGLLGEVFISGAGEARGYAKMPRRTAVSFVPSTIDDALGARMYRTGDIGAWENSEIAYRGRRDDQLQVRGVRVELSDVEAQLEGLSLVSRAAVSPVGGEAGRADGLVAFVSAAEECTPNDLRRALEPLLPAAVIPGRFVFVDAIPTLTSGKVDRQQLKSRVLELGSGSDSHQQEEPVNDVERRIARIWGELLDVERVGRHENFFSLGGHSLLAVRLRHRLSLEFDIDLPLSAMLSEPTVAQLAIAVSSAGDTRDRITKAVVSGDVPVSADQERMWYLQRLQRDSTAYNVPVLMELDGPLDVDLLYESIRRVVERHEILRTVFPSKDGEPIQQVLGSSDLFWEVVAASDGNLERLLEQRLRHAFDLTVETSIRVSLFQRAEDRALLLILFHHIVIDEWSTGLVFDEVRELYTSGVENRAPDLPPVSLQFTDFALWERSQREDGKHQAGLQFWREHLEGVQDASWRFGREQAAQRGPVGIEEVMLDDEVRASMEELARENQTSLFLVGYALVAAFMCRHVREPEITLGLPVTQREKTELSRMVGFLLNTVPLRAQPRASSTFVEWLRDVRALWARATPYLHINLKDIVATLGRAGAPFDIMYTYVPGEGATPEFGGLKARPFSAENLNQAQSALALTFSDAEQGLSAQFEYDSFQFEQSDVRALAEQFQLFVVECLEHRNEAIGARCIDTSAVRAGNHAARNRSVLELFHRHATQTPERVAICGLGNIVSYGELDRLACKVAKEMEELGVGPGDTVALAVPRDESFAASLLATWMLGATALPIDSSYPADRIEFMLEDSAPKLVLREGLVHSADGLQKRSKRRIPDPDEGAYVLYTSGSTGRPKGVRVPHSALANRTGWYLRSLDVRADDRFLHKTPLGFDVAMGEWCCALASGAAVVLLDGDHRDPVAIAKSIDRFDVTIVDFVPQQLDMLLDVEGFSGGTVRRVLVGGDVLSERLVRKVRAWSSAQLYNCYGPTEATIDCTWWPVVANAPRVLIGEPTDNNRVLLLDSDGIPVLPGFVGELCVAGANLAEGYVRKPGLTAERFVPEPGDVPGARMYLTGDLARGTQEGLEFLGRADQQVKVRGVRVELAEVEAALLEYSEVSQAAVVMTNGELVAYVVAKSSSEALNGLQLRRHLSQRLPSAMVPSHFKTLEKMPTSAAGKLDRAALEGRDLTAHREIELPTTESERKLAAIWAEHLGVSEIGRHDDFFALGGHSLLAVQLQRSVEEKFGIPISLSIILSKTTLSEMAKFTEMVPDEVVVRMGPEAYRHATVLVHPIGGAGFCYRTLASFLSRTEVLVIQSPGLIPNGHIPRTVAELARTYAGEVAPYLTDKDEVTIGGWSFGGVVAFEVARELSAQGVKVARVVMLDSYVHGIEVDEDPFVSFVADLVGTLQLEIHNLDELYSSMLDLKREERLAWLSDQLFKLGLRNFDEPTLARLLDVYSTHSVALANYQPQELEVPTILVAAADGGAGPAEGWQVQESLEVVSVSGSHYELISERHAALVSSLLAGPRDQGR